MGDLALLTTDPENLLIDLSHDSGPADEILERLTLASRLSLGQRSLNGEPE